MKRIALLAIVLASAAAAVSAVQTDELNHYLAVVAAAGVRLWESIQANPLPVGIAVGTFVITVVYLQLKGKTLRESVALAATRVTLVPVPKNEDENPVVRRAKARATRAQLIADQIAIQNRGRRLPEAIVAAEKDLCYAEDAVADAELKLESKEQAHEEAIAKLEALRNEKAASDAELAAIEVELKKLSELV